MSRGRALFHEVQRLPLRRVAVALVIPPFGMTCLLVWQVLLGHSWEKQPMPNGSVVFWTLFLWIIYFRLITVRLVTEVRERELVVVLRGLWRARHVPLGEILSVQTTTFDPERDYGGFGIRSGRFATAYIGSGRRGVRLQLASGAAMVVGSQQPEELANLLSSSCTRLQTGTEADRSR